MGQGWAGETRYSRGTTAAGYERIVTEDISCKRETHLRLEVGNPAWIVLAEGRLEHYSVVVQYEWKSGTLWDVFH